MIRADKPIRLVTIPSSDRAFREHVDSLHRAAAEPTPDALEDRLRLLFPRVVVRERRLSGEGPQWYVYRDGRWDQTREEPWWRDPRVPSLRISQDGWISDADPAAMALLGIDGADIGHRHFTDFVVPGTLQDAIGLFGVIDAGHELTATLRIRPTSGDVIAVDVHAVRQDDGVTGFLRLADDIDPEPAAPPEDAPELECLPATDPAFRGYVELLITRMPEPTPDGLALRLRRLYPHAQVDVREGRWFARRDGAEESGLPAAWWVDDTLPRVRYDAQATIIEANDAARELLGRDLVGHNWREFVTPGSTEQVTAMLAILAQVGAAESRFRMPAAGGSLVEFDSYTAVEDETLTTIMRPRSRVSA